MANRLKDTIKATVLSAALSTSAYADHEYESTRPVANNDTDIEFEVNPTTTSGAHSSAGAHSSSNAANNTHVGVGQEQATQVGVGQQTHVGVNGGNNKVETTAAGGHANLTDESYTAQEQDQQQHNYQESSQTTSLDNSGSGNSQQEQAQSINDSGNATSTNALGQSTNVAGNNSSYSSVTEIGAATNIPQAAAIFSTKACKSSFGLGAAGGETHAGYGGFSFNYVGSEAVALTGSVEIGGEQVEVAYTIPELADKNPQERAEIFENLSGSDQELATCLMGEYQQKQRALTQAYDQALDVARLNAQTQIVGKKIDGYTDIMVETIKANAGVDREIVRQNGEIAQIGMKHKCNQSGLIVKTGEHTEEVVAETLAIPRDKLKEGFSGHEDCGIRTAGAMKNIDAHERRPITVDVNYNQFDLD